MLAASRKDLILARLREDGRVVAKELATEFDVSEDSIRRDLRELDAAGLAVRVYGGALPASPAVAGFDERRGVAPDSKRRVAQAAARLIEPGSTVILDGGTTTLALIAALDPATECTIVTHAPTVAAGLLHHAAEVLLIGGTLFKHSAVACGAAAVEAAMGISADRFFLGVTGIHEAEEFTTGDAEEAAMKRVLASRAAETYVLGSEEKIGAASRFRVLGLDDVAGVITDGADSPTVDRLAERGVRVVS